MSEDPKSPDNHNMMLALRERLYELHHQRDLAEMEQSKIDARISEIKGMMDILEPPAEAERKHRATKDKQPFRVVETTPPPELPPEDAA